MNRVDWLPILALIYGAASLAHHVHNAVFLHDYPNLPVSLSVARVCIAWCVTALIGLAGYALTRRRHEVAGLVLLALYAALGFFGLSHYHLAPVGQHSCAMNASIGCEVVAAAVLLVAIARRLAHRAGTAPTTAHDK